MLFHRGGRRDRRRGLVGAGACALGLVVAGGWRVGDGWRWRARSGRGYWLARGWRLVSLLFRLRDTILLVFIQLLYHMVDAISERSIAGAGALVKFFFSTCFLS